jgi:HPr kinase/phosphorylase
MRDAPPPVHGHGTVVVVGEAGILIRGPSGSGKSTLALRLLAEAGRRGVFARLVGDDRVGLTAANGLVVARPHPAIAGAIERRTLPIAALASEPACVLRLVVELVTAPLPRLPDTEVRTTRLVDGVEVPVLRLAASSTDLACLFVMQELGRL